MEQRTLVCPQCGTTFTTSHPRKKWCSKPCTTLGNRVAQSAKKAKNYGPRPCSQCGDAFTPTRSDSQWCSLPCMRRAKYTPSVERNALVTCLYCEQSFVPRRSDRLYCSTLCQVRYRKAVPRVRLCDGCGIDVTSLGVRIRLCPSCKAARVQGHRQRNNQRPRYRPDGTLKQWVIHSLNCQACGDAFRSRSASAKACGNTCFEWMRKHPGVPRRLTRACLTCQRQFTTSTMARKYCATRCLRAAHKARRRARMAGVEHVPIIPADIFERDRWICGLCHRRIPKRLKAPHPMSASLDHIVPIADGGDHVPTNVHASHLRCNLSKNRRGGGEQLMLIG